MVEEGPPGRLSPQLGGREPSTGKGAIYSLLSQLSNSAGNVLLTVVIARNALPAEYGAWAIAYAGYMISLAAARSVACTPLLIRSHPSQTELRRHACGAIGVAAMTGITASLILLSLGGLSQTIFHEVWPFALVLPILLAQDAARFYCFASSRPQFAAMMDLSWLVLQVALFLYLELQGPNTSSAITIAWGLTSTAGLWWTVYRNRLLPRPRAIVYFWVCTRRDAAKLLADSAISSAVTQALPVIVGMTAGLAAAGALRGGLTLMGPINILVAGLTPMATIAARREHQRRQSTGSFLAVWSALIFLASTAYGATLWLLPSHIGEQLLGATWIAASALLAPLILQAVIRGPLTGVPIALRATRRVGIALQFRLMTVVPSILFPWGGALLFGLSGAVWGILLSAVANNLLSLWLGRKCSLLGGVRAT